MYCMSDESVRVKIHVCVVTSLIQFSLFCMAHCHKIQICLKRALQSVYTLTLCCKKCIFASLVPFEHHFVLIRVFLCSSLMSYTQNVYYYYYYSESR